MVQALPIGIQDTLDSGEVVLREFVKISLPSGTYGFWTGQGPYPYDGVIYNAGGSHLRVQAPPQVTDGSAQPIVIELSSVPDTALTPAVLVSFLNESYKRAPIVFSRGFFDPDTRMLIGMQWVNTALIDTAKIVETIGGEAKLVVNAESIAIDHRRVNRFMRSHQAQLLLDPTDLGYQYVTSVAARKVEWGAESKDPILKVKKI
jgi:hypothetical protein